MNRQICRLAVITVGDVATAAAAATTASACVRLRGKGCFSVGGCDFCDGLLDEETQTVSFG